MKVYDRLKMELSNQQYLTEEQYNQFLIENGLSPLDEFNKNKMYKQLLYTVLDILEAIANDIDLMSTISTEFANVGQAYQFVEARIAQVKDKIAAIPEEDEEYSAFSLMFTKEPYTAYRPSQYGSRSITRSEIDVLLGKEDR